MLCQLLITLFYVVGVVSLVGGILVLVFLRSPVSLFRSYAVCLKNERDVRLMTLVFVALILAHVLYVFLQNRFGFGGFWDMTALVAKYELSMHAIFAVIPCSVNFGFAFAYFFLFPALPLVMFLALDFTNNVRMLLNYVIALDLCLLACLLAFIVVEMSEVWSVDLKRQYYLCGDVCRMLLNERRVNHLGNCFPSLHTAFMVITAAVAFMAKIPRLAVVVVSASAVVVLATLTLGVHWYVDLLAGLVMGIGCLLAAEKIGALHVKNS